MKTFKTILITGFVTIMVGVIFVGHFLLSEGIVTIQEKSTAHEKIVMIDGKVTEKSTWGELLGYTVSIDVKDSAYFGK